MNLNEVKFDCRHFKGHIPCLPNKLRDKICSTCDEYTPIEKRILIIKLGALGDVIRTTPLAVRYRKMYPNAKITWITLSKAILPKDLIDEIFEYNTASVYQIRNKTYDIAINLDKEPETCILLNEVNAEQKFGFTWKNNHIAAATPEAEHKLITGFFDNISKTNTKNYLEEIFEICQLDFQNEPYVLNYNKSLAQKWNSIKEKAKGKSIIGLNTGCGKRWQTRLWQDESWIELIRKLQKNNFFPILLGGKDENEKNTFYHQQTNAYYPGHYSLEEFIALSSNCDLIVSQVSMMMHIAIGLKVPLVLMNNIFNPHEFYLYENGTIIEPSTGCDCYYGNSCSRNKNCMQDVSVDSIFNAIVKTIV